MSLLFVMWYKCIFIFGEFVNSYLFWLINCDVVNLIKLEYEDILDSFFLLVKLKNIWLLIELIVKFKFVVLFNVMWFILVVKCFLKWVLLLFVD